MTVNSKPTSVTTSSLRCEIRLIANENASASSTSASPPATAATAATAATSSASSASSASSFDKDPSRLAQQAATADVSRSVADIAVLATTAIARTATIKTSLRAEINGLLQTNTATLRDLRSTSAQLTKEAYQVTKWDVLCANFNVAGTNRASWVDILYAKEIAAVASVEQLEARMGSWTRSIGAVEAEVSSLEQHALKLAQPAPVAGNVAVLRATAGTIGSLTALEANLARQVTLLTDLRDKGAVLNASLTGHLVTVTKLLEDARALLEQSHNALMSLIRIMVSPNPSLAAEDFVKKQIADKVQEALEQAGVTPGAFADRLLDGKDALTISVLRPQLVAAFSAALPPVFSTGSLD